MTYFIDTDPTVFCRSIRFLEPKTRQPCFDFLHSVALDFDSPTGANSNGVVARIFWNGDLEGRSEFVEEDIPVARDLFDPCRYSGAVLSVTGCANEK